MRNLLTLLGVLALFVLTFTPRRTLRRVLRPHVEPPPPAPCAHWHLCAGVVRSRGHDVFLNCGTCGEDHPPPPADYFRTLARERATPW